MHADRFEPTRTSLNCALAFAALVVTEAGEIEAVTVATTLPEAQWRANELRYNPEMRRVR